VNNGEESSTLLQALGYLQHGWSLLPLRGKRPNTRLIRRTRGSSGWRGFCERRAGEDEVREWTAHDPSTDLGVVSGEVSGGLVILDADEKAPAGTRIPPTPIARTARGEHFFLHSAEPVRTRSLGWGELRGERAYTAVPPSTHEDGVSYRWTISPAELPFAELEAAEIPSHARAIAVTAVPGVTHPICSTHGLTQRGRQGQLGRQPKNLNTPTWESGLAELDREPSAVERMTAVLGVPPLSLGRAFSCVLHADKTPSATLWRPAEGERIVYHDWHRRGGPREWLSLAQVRATLAGRPHASGPELAIWKLRLLAEADLLDPVELIAPSLPDGADEVLQRVWRGFLFLVGCRWAHEPGVGAPFARRFAAAWCGLSEWDVREAFGRLTRLGLVLPAGEYGRDPLWLPFAAAPGPGNDENNGRR
jgi:hypothetical protein